MQIINDTQLDYSDVLIQPKRSSLRSRADVDIFRPFTLNLFQKLKIFDAIPVMAANMASTGTPKMAKILVRSGFLCALEKHCPNIDIINLYAAVQDYERLDCVQTGTYTNRIALSIGTRESIENLVELKSKLPCNVSIINIDVPNGYAPQLIERVREVRQVFPIAFIIAGTVVTSDATQDLIIAGADCVRVGIGGGSACTTRLKTGVGRPMISTIAECADAAHQLHRYVMADGGIQVPGDICKALCAGADLVMCGGIFAGADEAGGQTVEIDGKTYKQFFGMSSNMAQSSLFDGVKPYRTSEGREKLIPCVGPLANILTDITGGLRSCCTYIGSHCIKHMPKHATFYRVNRQLNTVFDACRDIQ